MDAIKAGNVAVRFFLELCALAALAYWGATVGVRMAGRIALAVALPGLAALIWALVVAPGARIDLGAALRLVLEILIFGAAVTVLLLRHQVTLAVVLALVYLINRVLMAIWDQ